MDNLLEALTRHCNRCKHTWLIREAREPVHCPACNSPYWNKKRVFKIAKRRRASPRPKGEDTPRDSHGRPMRLATYKRKGGKRK